MISLSKGKYNARERLNNVSVTLIWKLEKKKTKTLSILWIHALNHEGSWKNKGRLPGVVFFPFIRSLRRMWERWASSSVTVRYGAARILDIPEVSISWLKRTVFPFYLQVPKTSEEKAMKLFCSETRQIPPWPCFLITAW